MNNSIITIYTQFLINDLKMCKDNNTVYWKSKDDFYIKSNKVSIILDENEKYYGDADRILVKYANLKEHDEFKQRCVKSRSKKSI